MEVELRDEFLGLKLKGTELLLIKKASLLSNKKLSEYVRDTMLVESKKVVKKYGNLET